ncbi:MAG: Adaptive-response sensory-kinase SasA [Planctomycetes bacterium]|nr:Adaptive-response sensory-kinase SasA [Planctomycetota bacterium]
MRRTWLVYGTCAALVLVAMGFVSSLMLTLERGQFEADAAIRHQERQRVALWRMDTWLAAVVAREAARDPSGDAVGTALPGDAPDPLVWARFAAYPGALRSLWIRGSAVEWNVSEPAKVARVLGTNSLTSLTGVVTTQTLNVAAQNGDDGPPSGPLTNFQNRDFQQRARTTFASRQSPGQGEAQSIDLVPRGFSVTDGILVAAWIPTAERESLALLRRARGSDMPNLPPPVIGSLIAWDDLRPRLLAEIADVLPGAALRAVPESVAASDTTGLVLATAPIGLVAPPPPVTVPLVTPARAGLSLAWVAVLVAMGAAALTLRSAAADAERRARFAASVTHELRTPLTTFRLYSEMLADGIVRDEAARAEYLATLKRESARLSTLVENVLAFARVEEGRAARDRERTTVADVIARIEPALRRRADEAGMTLVIRDAAGAAPVVVNADAVGQILANLVDNACKYSAEAADRTIDVTTEARGGEVRIAVRDRGPGVARRDVEAAFTPFERGNRPPGDRIPGIGLGLALSRGFARDHGGDLVHEAPGDGPGASFVLTLPLAA